MTSTALPDFVSAEEWQDAREAFLTKEKAATRLLADLAAQRRRLPMLAVSTGYTFTDPDGPAGLLDLFDGRRQLVVYQMMDNGPGARGKRGSSTAQGARARRSPVGCGARGNCCGEVSKPGGRTAPTRTGCISSCLPGWENMLRRYEVLAGKLPQPQREHRAGPDDGLGMHMDSLHEENDIPVRKIGRQTGEKRVWSPGQPH